MDVVFVKKAVALIVRGIDEKEHLLRQKPQKYPYSKRLQHGINMFLAAAWEIGGVPFTILDEASFLQVHAEKPLWEWFENWQLSGADRQDLTTVLDYDSLFFQTGEGYYELTGEGGEFLSTLEKDLLAGTDECTLYEKMICLSQKNYCILRRFLIEHPIAGDKEFRAVRLELADDESALEALEFAYESFEGEYYQCPKCHWIMTKTPYGYHCHTESCVKCAPSVTPKDLRREPVRRLKKGVMRYMAAPGRLEMKLAEQCENLHLHYELWPHMDRYDLEIHLPNGAIWAIDAKAYRNPLSLRTQLEQDTAFANGTFQKGFYVVPQEYARKYQNYLHIINDTLAQKGSAYANVQCVTDPMLKRLLIKELEEADA